MRLVLLSFLLIFPTPPTFILFIFFVTTFTVYAMIKSLTNYRDQLH